MCCFAGDTKIKLANGKSKAIKDLKKGDVLKGVTGKNTITKIHKPWLHFRKKYSINNGEYFTTAEHPFQTTKGWRAIKPYRKWYDPECWDNYLHSHKDLKQIKPLEIGDKIITEKGQIKIQSITSSWNFFKWFETVYNISLDNDNTYYADGFLVHNKGGGGIIGKIFRPIVNIFKKIIKAVTNIFSGFLGAFGMSFDMPDMGGGADYEDTNSGILVNKQSNVAGIPVVYGERKIGGTRVWAGTTGEDTKYLYIALVVAEGEINGFTKLYIDDEEQAITFPVNPTDGTTVSVVDGSKYYVNGASKAEFQFFTGAENQTYSHLLANHDNWTEAHKLRGCAYVACRFEWVKADFDDDGNQTRFNPWRGMPTINVVIQGKKVLSGNYSSHGTTTANTYGTDLSSFTYSDNPADCLLDYLRNPRYGKALPDNRIDWSAFRDAQVVCDTTCNFGTTDMASVDFLNCNTYVKPEDNMFQNTKKLLQCCRGFLPYTNGKYQLKIEAGETRPDLLLEITDDKILGKINVVSPDKNSKYNEAHITFSNSQKLFEPDTAIYENSTYKTEDGGETLTLTIGAPGITRRERALQYAEYLVKRSRKQLQLQLRTTSECQQLVAGDLCTVTHRFDSSGTPSSSSINDYMFYGTDVLEYNTGTPGQNDLTVYTPPSKIWRVTAQKLNYDGTVDLNLIEHQNDIYAVTQQQEETHLSAIENHTPPGQEQPQPTPDPVSDHFTITSFVATDGVTGQQRPGLKINNNTYQDIDARAVKVIYKLTSGTSVFVNPVTLPNPYGSSFNSFEYGAKPFTWQQTIKLNISSEYENGQQNPIESHTIILKADPNAEKTGGINSGD